MGQVGQAVGLVRQRDGQNPDFGRVGVKLQRQLGILQRHHNQAVVRGDVFDDFFQPQQDFFFIVLVPVSLADFAEGLVFPGVRVAVVLGYIFLRSWVAPLVHESLAQCGFVG